MATDFTAAFDLSDIAFIVEGRRLYASKAVLAMWSPAFKAMFTQDFKEKHVAEILLPGKHFDDMLELLQVLHPPNKALSDENVGVALSLAREYQMDVITERCKAFLLAKPPRLNYLALAEEFQLHALKTHCKDYIEKTQVKKLKMDPDFDSIEIAGGPVMSLLLNRLLKYEQAFGNITEIVKGRQGWATIWKLLGESTCEHVGFCSCADAITLFDMSNPREDVKEDHKAVTESSCPRCAFLMVEAVIGVLEDLPPAAKFTY